VQVRTGHPRFFNQISTGLDIVCLAGEWLTATTNTNMFTYEIAPVFVLMEREVSRKMIELIGWPEGTPAAGGQYKTRPDLTGTIVFLTLFILSIRCRVTASLRRVAQYRICTP
jgi:hypothetical protein